MKFRYGIQYRIGHGIPKKNSIINYSRNIKIDIRIFQVIKILFFSKLIFQHYIFFLIILESKIFFLIIYFLLSKFIN